MILRVRLGRVAVVVDFGLEEMILRSGLGTDVAFPDFGEEKVPKLCELVFRKSYVGEKTG